MEAHVITLDEDQNNISYQIPINFFNNEIKKYVITQVRSTV